MTEIENLRFLVKVLQEELGRALRDLTKIEKIVVN